MPHTVRHLEPEVLNRELLELLLDEHVRLTLPRLGRLWDYYRNESNGPGQRQGLPQRLRSPDPAGQRPPREVVIENDIAWRIHTLADFMFGRPVALQSTAPDPSRAAMIERFLRDVFDLSGGPGFFQDLALLGSVYGFVDVLLRVNPGGTLILETIDAPRAISLPSADDFRVLDAYILHYRQQTHEIERDNFLMRMRDRVLAGRNGSRRAIVERTQVWTPGSVESFVNRKRVASEANPLGRIPMVHIQNLSQPFSYEGLSEVEPLIPPQDELNTRLSDRANRVTFQSFKMYLGRGIEKFTERPVGPGQMWATDNADASIQEFGGDGASPSEDAHITEVREAMDKTSGVSPVATGVVRDKVGNLTSENALRIVMMGLLAKTQKKRLTYGVGIAQLAELILHAADVFGILPNAPDERRIRLDWPDPMPDSEAQRLRHAQTKIDLGVPRKQVLAELGYDDIDTNEPPTR